MTLAVIIPVYNASRLLSETLVAVLAGTRLPNELIVIDDGSTDGSATIADRLGARVIVMPRNIGPAACRNQGALLAQSDLLVFLDADTCVHSGTLAQIASLMDRDPTLVAVIGAYDDNPRAPGLCSQYRNLAHCYVHRHSSRRALTFWSGCGAVRREVFLEAGGFDETYDRPSIEDIEFGYRLSDRGAKILLDPSICVTHTKRWTIRNCIKTDVADRGIPWMVLLLERGIIPDDLNIKKRHRLAAILTGAALVVVFGAFRSLVWIVVSAALFGAALCLDFGLLHFMYAKGGVRLLAVAAPMTLLQNACKLAAFVGGFLLYTLRRWRGKRPARSRILSQRAGISGSAIPVEKSESRTAALESRPGYRLPR